MRKKIGLDQKINKNWNLILLIDSAAKVTLECIRITPKTLIVHPVYDISGIS